jgi:hypothetical protein
LQRLKQPFHPPLGLRRVGCDELDAQLAQRLPKLTLWLRSSQLLFTVGSAGERYVECLSA